MLGACKAIFQTLCTGGKAAAGIGKATGRAAIKAGRAGRKAGLLARGRTSLNAGRKAAATAYRQLPAAQKLALQKTAYAAGGAVVASQA